MVQLKFGQWTSSTDDKVRSVSKRTINEIHYPPLLADNASMAGPQLKDGISLPI